MDGRWTWTDCDEAGDYVVPNVFSPRDLVFRPDNMEETVLHTWSVYIYVIQTQYRLVLVKIIVQTFQIKTEDFLSPQFILKAL